jgi:hypothetical protein
MSRSMSLYCEPKYHPETLLFFVSLLLFFFKFYTRMFPRFFPHDFDTTEHHVIKFVSDLRQVGGFLRVLRFPPPIKLTSTI